jgi:shikimate dehydrogenase
LKLGLFGRPVGHSKSPMIFRRLGKLIGRKISYEAVEVAPGLLPVATAWAKVVGWSGASVTIPYKLEAYELAEKKTAAAAALGAVNVLKIGKDLIGHNTDGDGLADALKRARIPVKGNDVLIFGAGGAARAAGWACAKNGARKVRYHARRVEQARMVANKLARHFKGTAFSAGTATNSEIWINATPLGMKGFPDVSPASKKLASPKFAMDLVYGTKTAFQKDALRRGAQTHDGSAMLVLQALRAYEFWGGHIRSRDKVAEKLIKELS